MGQLVENILDCTPNFPICVALSVIKDTYGDEVYVKPKTLNKFGRNNSVGTTFEELVQLPSAVLTVKDTVTTNAIDTISSSAAGDTSKTFVLEGHTIDGSGNLTFTIQEFTTNASDGRTEVALTTPLARATRCYLKPSGTFGSPQTAAAGVIYVYDNAGGSALGVPSTLADVALILQIGDTQSEHGSTSISFKDYWIITELWASIGDSANSVGFVTIRPQIRDVANGGAWRPLGKPITLVPGQNGVFEEFIPTEIVPKNHDYRVLAKTDANTAEVYVETRGYLATLVA